MNDSVGDWFTISDGGGSSDILYKSKLETDKGVGKINKYQHYQSFVEVLTEQPYMRRQLNIRINQKVLMHSYYGETLDVIKELKEERNSQMLIRDKKS